MLGQTTTHATLLARVATGADPAAWREFCDRYEELIRGFARRQGLQSADCDEVVQDVLLALTQAMPGFAYDPARGKFRSYLKTVALHAAYRRSRQKAGEIELGLIESTAEALAADEEADQRWEAEWRQYHLRQAMRTIETEFGRLDREAFDAYAAGGEDARSVAERLGLSLDQVYQAKSRILRRLGQIIEEQMREEG